jgi:hypothetical protein
MRITEFAQVPMLNCLLAIESRRNATTQPLLKANPFKVQNMKKSKFVLAALAMAASFAASAADVSWPTQSLTWAPDMTIDVEGDYASKNGGNTFSNKYEFTTLMAGTLSGGIQAIGGGNGKGLDITDFSLYNAGGLVLAGTQLSSGVADFWTFTADNLAAGTYYVQVGGSIAGNGATHYNDNLAQAPVPEPETYAMMLGGLGLLGFAARRKAKKQA